MLWARSSRSGPGFGKLPLVIGWQPYRSCALGPSMPSSRLPCLSASQRRSRPWRPAGPARQTGSWRRGRLRAMTIQSTAAYGRRSPRCPGGLRPIVPEGRDAPRRRGPRPGEREGPMGITRVPACPTVGVAEGQGQESLVGDRPITRPGLHLRYQAVLPGDGVMRRGPVLPRRVRAHAARWGRGWGAV